MISVSKAIAASKIVKVKRARAHPQQARQADDIEMMISVLKAIPAISYKMSWVLRGGVQDLVRVKVKPCDIRYLLEWKIILYNFF